VARTPWYEAQPERVEWELERLRGDAGVAVESERRQDGVYSVATTLTFGGENLPVQIHFPRDYPDAPPSICAEHLVLDRHQERVSLNFCLLDNPDTDWSPGRSAAELVLLLKKLLADTEQGAGAVAGGEGDMPEPASSYYRYTRGIAVLVSEPFLGEQLDRRDGQLTLVENTPGNVLFLLKADGFEDAPRELASRVADVSKTLSGVWLAVEEAPDPAAVNTAIAELLEERAPAMLKALKKRARDSRQKVATKWVGVTFMEEGPTLGDVRRTWVFFEVEARRGEAALSVRRIAQAQALTLTERQRRLPELGGFESQRMLVIGAGSLGGSIALELAKAGIGELDIVDSDTYDVNNAVRHIGETQFAGAGKAEMVAMKCRAMNPFAIVTGHPFSVGSTSEASDQLDELVGNADVVIETTGSEVVTRIIQQRCREAGKTLVVAALTAGSYGGEVLVVRPTGACFDCFIFAQEDHAVPEPEAGPRHRVTPVGCRHPAFSGAGFDATELATVAARTAVRATGAVSYPPLDYEWIVVNFRGQPMYEKGALNVHPDCPREHG
jgi:molybdopterin/thiamine biosynthesis adenylyltransferase/ubiquitin-protein ligase